MKQSERIIYLIIIAILMYVSFTRTLLKQTIVTIPGDIKIDTVKVTYDSLIYRIDSIPYDSITWLHDTVFLPTDTAKILTDYFKIISYDSISLRNDSSITNWIRVKVTQNRLYEVKGYSLNNRKTSIIEDHNNLGIGAIVGKQLVAPTISYQFNQHQFGIGYNVVGSGLVLQYEYKFKLK